MITIYDKNKKRLTAENPVVNHIDHTNVFLRWLVETLALCKLIPNSVEDQYIIFEAFCQ